MKKLTTAEVKGLTVDGLKEIPVTITGGQVKFLPIPVLMAMGQLVQDGKITITEGGSNNSIGTIGALSQSELEGTTNANRAINWEEVNTKLIDLLNGGELTTTKTIHDGLKRTLSKALTSLGALTVLENPNNLRKVVGVETLENTSAKILKTFTQGCKIEK